MTSLDYSRVADIYDAYCLYEEDIPFWVTVAQQTQGRILELMTGTGRISLPLMKKGRQVVCVDCDANMLSVLRRKAQSHGSSAQVVCADVSDLPFSEPFDLILLPFQGFSELIREEQQRRALEAIAGCLSDRGTFVCTLHNPRVRRQAIDGSWHEVVRAAHPNGNGSLAVGIKADFDVVSRVVRGTQRIDEYDDAGRVARSRSLSLSFSLLEKEHFLKLVEEAALEVTSLQGDYNGSPFDRENSPVMIWWLKKIG
jgi:16S rRNA G966 N2-methylase RsmD